jgi:hypothetical protein
MEKKSGWVHLFVNSNKNEDKYKKLKCKMISDMMEDDKIYFVFLMDRFIKKKKELNKG